MSLPGARHSAEDEARYRALGLWTDETLGDVLRDLASRHGERVALVDATGTCSYAELADESARLAAGLHALGIHAGDAVLVQLPNSRAFVVLCFALFQIGARPVMAQLAHREHELCAFASATRAVAHAVARERVGCDFSALSARVQSACPSLRHTLLLGEARAPHERSLVDLARGAGALPSDRPVASDVALFQLSGGSTATPKLIPRTHRDYLYSVRASVSAVGFDARAVFLAALPAAHNFTLSSPGVLGALVAGGRVVLADSATPDVGVPWVAREQVDTVALVPALVPSWLALAKKRRADVRSLRHLLVGGARLPRALATRIVDELGVQLTQVYGMAEGLVCYTDRAASHDDVLDGVVRPMSAYDELRVVDARGESLPAGSAGALETRGPYTICSYHGADPCGAEAFSADGFYRTGDLVVARPDGALSVVGRVKDQINRAGEKIACPEVERALEAHPSVVAAALVALPDPFLGERSCAFVLRRDEVSAQTLGAHLEALGLAAYKWPDDYVFPAALPRTPVGKVDKRALAREAATRAAHSRSPHADGASSP